MAVETRTWWQRLFFGASVGALASVIGQAGTFLLGLAIARILGSDEFGHWSVIYATLLTVTSFATLGTGVVASKYAAELRHEDCARTRASLSVLHRLNLMLALAGSALLFIGSGFLASRVLGNPEAAEMLRWGSLFVLFTVLAAFWSGVIAGYEAYPKQVVNNLVVTLLLFGTSFVLLPRFGLLSVIGTLGLSAGIQLIANRHAARKLNPNAARAESGAQLPWSATLALALPTGAAGILTSATFWLSTTLLLRAGGPTQVALFAVSNSLRSLALMALMFLTSAALVIKSSAARRGDLNSGLEDRLHLTVLGVSVAVALALYGVAGWILALYGPVFREAIGIVAIFSVSLVIEAVGITLYNSLVVRHRLLENFFVAVVPREICRIVLVVALADTGAPGIAWAFLVATTLLTTITAVEYYGFARHVAPSAGGKDEVEAAEPVGVAIN